MLVSAARRCVGAARRHPGAFSSAVVLVALAAMLIVSISWAGYGDVEIYRIAGHLVRHDRIYAYRDSTDHGFTYPPFAALGMTLPGMLPLHLAWVLIDLVSLGCLALIVRLTDPTLIRRARAAQPSAALLVAGVLAAQPVVATLRFGQVNLILAALVMVDLLVWRRGVLIGLAVAVKLTPAIFVLYLLWAGRVREAVVACLTFAATIAAGLLIVPHSSRRFWTREIISESGIRGFDHAGNQSIRGLAVRILGSHPGTLVWAMLVVPVLAIGLELARRCALLGYQPLAAGIVGITGCLISPVSWTHHWIWVVPVFVSLVPIVASGPDRRARIVVHTLLAEVVVWTVVPTAFERMAGVRILGSGYVVLALLGFAVLGAPVLRGGRRRRARLETGPNRAAVESSEVLESAP